MGLKRFFSSRARESDARMVQEHLEHLERMSELDKRIKRAEQRREWLYRFAGQAMEGMLSDPTDGAPPHKQYVVQRAVSRTLTRADRAEFVGDFLGKFLHRVMVGHIHRVGLGRVGKFGVDLVGGLAAARLAAAHHRHLGTLGGELAGDFLADSPATAGDHRDLVGKT